MITITGKIFEVFRTDGGGVGADAYDGVDKAQFIGLVSTKNGSKKAQILDVKIYDSELFKKLKNQNVSLEVSPYAIKNGVISWSSVLGAVPEVVKVNV